MYTPNFADFWSCFRLTLGNARRQDPLSPSFLFVAPGVWPAEKEKEGGRDGTALPARPMAESRIQWVDRSINMSICFLSSNPVMTLASPVARSLAMMSNWHCSCPTRRH